MHKAIITAYKDWPMLDRLTQTLVDEGLGVFVHIDRRSAPPADLLTRLAARGCVVRRRHRIYWGSYTHLRAVIEMMRLALADPATRYVHVISGQDYPAYRVGDIDRLCDGGIFMQCEPLEATAPDVQRRFGFYRLLWWLEPIRNVPRPFDAALLAVQRAFRVRRIRTRDCTRIYKGLLWGSFPADAARHAVESRAGRRLLRDLRFTWLAEEFFFQTALMNSAFAGRVRPTDLRFMDWSFRHGTRPAVLDDDDRSAVTAADALFARKVDSRVSASLLDWLRGWRGERETVSPAHPDSA